MGKASGFGKEDRAALIKVLEKFTGAAVSR